MSRTDEEEILWAADLIRTWEWKYEVAEIIHTFYVLNELPLDKYPDAWNELREAFRNNEDLNHPTVKKNLSVPPNAEGGRWWWDAELW